MPPQYPARQQYSIATDDDFLPVSEGVTDDYEKWSNDWAFVNAVRAGRVSFVVHVHTGKVIHVNYEGGPVPNFGD